jgi:hypothetical protein
MPVMPRFLLNTSNIHNFWSISPQIMKFILMQSLLWGSYSQIVSKNLKIIWDQVTLRKSSLVIPSTFSPLRINFYRSPFWTSPFLVMAFPLEWHGRPTLPYWNGIWNGKLLMIPILRWIVPSSWKRSCFLDTRMSWISWKRAMTKISWFAYYY